MNQTEYIRCLSSYKIVSSIVHYTHSFARKQKCACSFATLIYRHKLLQHRVVFNHAMHDVSMMTADDAYCNEVVLL